jgi:hypothetical protein
MSHVHAEERTEHGCSTVLAASFPLLANALAGRTGRPEGRDGDGACLPRGTNHNSCDDRRTSRSRSAGHERITRVARS